MRQFLFLFYYMILIIALSIPPRDSHVHTPSLLIAISEFDYALNSRSRKTGRAAAVCIEADFTATTCQSPLLSRGKWDFLASRFYFARKLPVAKSKDRVAAQLIDRELLKSLNDPALALATGRCCFVIAPRVEYFINSPGSLGFTASLNVTEIQLHAIIMIKLLNDSRLMIYV